MDEKEKERERLRTYKCPEHDPNPETSGVLLSDEIESYIFGFKLIDPYECHNLDPAGYKLRVGNECAIGGEKKILNEEYNNEIEIPPFEVAVIKTHETINLPRFLIARWNIYISLAYKGLVWVGGPQVDPGYVGHLFCPVYNLSNQKVKLKLYDKIAVIDFIKTTPFEDKYLFNWDDVPGSDSNKLINFLNHDLNINWVNNSETNKFNDNRTIRISNKEKLIELELYETENKEKKAKLIIDKVRARDLLVREEKNKLKVYRKSKEFTRPSKRNIFDDYPILRSALFTEAGEKIKVVEEKMNKFETKLNTNIEDFQTKLDTDINNFQTRLDTNMGYTFTAIAVLVAALSIFVSSSQDVKVTLPTWMYIILGFSIVAIILSILAYHRFMSKVSIPTTKEDELRTLIEKHYTHTKILTLILGLISIIVILIFWGLLKYHMMLI